MWKRLLSVAIFIATCSGAMAQGQLPAGNVWGNPLASGAPAKPSTVTAILDRALGSTRGSILERGASGWAIVGPGATAGLAWISAGTGADPAYGILGLSGGGCNAALVASNGGILYSTASACAILAGTATARLPLLSGASTTPVWGAYTLPASVTSGGVPCFVSTSAEGSSVLLTANALVLGGGAATCPSPMASLGTTTTVLHGNAAGPPTFAAVNLTTDVSNQLPFANGGCNGTTQQSCFDNAAPTPTRAGDLAYWNGTHWVTLAGNNSGTQILTENASGVPAWAANGSVSSVTCFGVAITTSGTCTIAATKSDEQTGTSTTAVVTPSQQQQHDSAAKAWADFTGSTGAILTSYNVTSITRNGVGDYTVTFTTAFASANYACHLTSESAGNAANAMLAVITTSPTAKTASLVRIGFENAGATAAVDPNIGHLVCFGRQ